MPGPPIVVGYPPSPAS